MAQSTEVRVALISGAFALATAAASAVISYQVSTSQIAAQKEKLRLEDRVARANLFLALIKDLEKAGTANYALLALWQLYKEKEDRNIILAAAIQNPDPKTFQMLRTLGFQQELKPYLDDIEQVLRKDGGSSGVARDLLVDIDPERYLTFLIEDLQNGGKVEFLDRRIQDILVVLRANPKLEAFVTERLDAGKENYSTISFALYASGNKAVFRNSISEIAEHPIRNLHRLASIVSGTDGQFEESDWIEISKAAATVIGRAATPEAAQAVSDETLDVAIKLFRRQDFRTGYLEETARRDLARALTVLFFKDTLQSLRRADIVTVMMVLNRPFAAWMYAKSRACGIPDPVLDILLDDTLSGVRGDDATYPTESAMPAVWNTWTARNRPEESHDVACQPA